MNKGLLVHMLSFIAYMTCVGYVTQGDDNAKGTRMVIVVCLIMTQIIVAGINDASGNYKKKI